eukprot:EG_transcript_14269
MWARLPPDAQLRVCLFLGPRDLVQLERSSAALRVAARRPEVWMELCRLTYPTMFEGIMAKGQPGKLDSAPGPSTGSVLAGPKGRPKRGGGRRRGRVPAGEAEEGEDGSAASLEVTSFPSSSSSSSRAVEKRGADRSGKSDGGVAGQCSAGEGQRAIREGESAVGLLVAELRALEDEARRCERQRTVLYAEDVAAREELTAHIDEMQSTIAELQESLMATEQSLMDLHLTHGTATSIDWQRVFALRTRKQQHWARRKGRKQERQEVLQANKSLDPNYNRSLRVTARQRTCTTCYRRFVVDDNSEDACHFHPGRYLHDDARCTCGGAIRQARPAIDAEMAQCLKKALIKNNGRLTSNVSVQVRRGKFVPYVCAFAYACCGAHDVKTPGCTAGRHTWR